MNFLEAVKAYKEDKKVEHLDFPGYILHYIHTSWVLRKEIINTNSWTSVDVDYVLSDKWIIVDEDKDWSLVDNGIFDIQSGWSKTPRCDLDSIKKCRDLILKDIQNVCTNKAEQLHIENMINKRFGQF